MSVAEEIDKLGKLGLGTVTDPQTRTWALRTIFFWVADQKARPTIDELHNRCRGPMTELRRVSKELLPNDHADFPPVVITIETDSSVTQRLHYVMDWASLCLAADYFQCAAEIRTLLWEWVSKRNVAVAWFLDVVYLMVCVASPTEPFPWSFPGTMGVRQDGVRFGGPIGSQLLLLKSSKPVPVLPSFNPAVQDRNHYLLDIQKRLQAYCNTVEAEFKRAGFEPTLRKRQRSGPQWMHVEWFVRNRLELWPQKRIAEQYRVAEDVVSKAVRKTADLLEFPKGVVRR